MGSHDKFFLFHSMLLHDKHFLSTRGIKTFAAKHDAKKIPPVVTQIEKISLNLTISLCRIGYIKSFLANRKRQSNEKTEVVVSALEYQERLGTTSRNNPEKFRSALSIEQTCSESTNATQPQVF